MLTLVLESCTERSIVALVEDMHCLYMAGLPFGLQHSRYLLPKVEEGFHRIERHPPDLDCIAVGTGPGSYTGIRVGATVAKTLSYSCQVPLIGLCTLEGFIPGKEGRFISLIDAKMAGAYMIKGEKKGEEITYLSDPEACSLGRLKEHFTGGETLVSPSFERLKPNIEKAIGRLECVWEETAPDPIHLAQRAEKKYRQGMYSLDGFLEILYMRGEDQL